MTTAPRSRFHPFHSQPAAWQHHILDSASLRKLSGLALYNAQVARHANGAAAHPPSTTTSSASTVASPRHRSNMALPGSSSPPSLLATAVDPVGASKKDDESSHHFATPLLSISADNHITDIIAPHSASSHHLRSRFSSPGTFAAVFGSAHSTALSQLHHTSLLPAPHAHDQFVTLLQDELSRVNAFVIHRTAELRQQFINIEAQASRIVGKKDVSPLPSPTQAATSDVTDTDATEDDPTLDPIKAGYVDLYGQVMLLQSFAVQHASLFTSIVRQYSLFSASEKGKYMEKLESVEMKHNREIMELLEHIEVVYGELCIADYPNTTAGIIALSDFGHQPSSPEATDSLLHSKTIDHSAGSTVAALSSSALSAASSVALLRSQARALLFTHQQQPTSWSTFDRGLRFGITLLLFFWVLWDCVVDARIRPQYPVEWVQSVLPVYRGIGVLLLLEWGWGCNLYIWDKYRINYMQLLELDTRSTMTYAEVFDEATTASMMFLANFLIYFKILRGDFPPWIPAGYFPILLFIYMLYKLLPWSGHGRSVIWYGLAQVVLSPFGRVIFLTTYTGDILTSLVKPIIDWSYTLCFLVTLEWVDDTVNDEVCLQSRLFNYVIVPLLSALPLWFRFMQCLTGDHMVMTRSGWRSIVVIHREFEEARLKVAAGVEGAALPAIELSTFNTTTRAMEWKRVVATQRFAANQPGMRLFRMQGEGMDVLATEGHRMLIGRLGETRAERKQYLVADSFATPTVDELASLTEFKQHKLATVTAFAHHPSRVVVRCGDNRQQAYQFIIEQMGGVCAWWWTHDQQRGFLRFLGFWLGDGSLDISTNQRVVIAQRKLESVACLIDLLDEVFPRWWYRNVSANDSAGITFNFTVRCLPLFEWLRVMAVGPAGYHPLDPVQLRKYPHFDYDAQVVEAEAASSFGRARVMESWREEEMLGTFRAGPVRRPCCICQLASGVRVSCSGKRCHQVDAITRAHPACIGRTEREAFQRLQRVGRKNRNMPWPWFCPHSECQMEAAEWAAAHPFVEPMPVSVTGKRGCSAEAEGAATQRVRKGAGEKEEEKEDEEEKEESEAMEEWEEDEEEEEEEEEDSEVEEVMPRQLLIRTGRLSSAPSRLVPEMFDVGELADIALPAAAAGAERPADVGERDDEKEWVCECGGHHRRSVSTCPRCNGELGEHGQTKSGIRRQQRESAVARAPEGEGTGTPSQKEEVAAPAPVLAVAAQVIWNNAVWDIDADGNWYYRKRWLGPDALVASSFANLSQPQAVALLEGFNRADGVGAEVQFDSTGKPTGSWHCSNSSMPLIHHLQLIGQLAGARVDMWRHSKEGKQNKKGPKGRTLTMAVDHWALSLNFNKIRGAEDVHLAMLAKPVDVSADVDQRGYYEHKEDGFVYDLTMADNSNFLTQRYSIRSAKEGVTNIEVRAHPVYVGNCLRRYMDTRKRWPHLANAGKYALSHSVVLFGVFHHTFTDQKSMDSYRVYWIISLVISTLYSYLWDIFIDFGLGDMRYGGLRDQLMYSSKTVYYVCIVADLFLRFAWSLTLVPRGEHAPFAPSVIIYLQPMLAVAEVTRRCMWGALRLEWEHINVLGFKKAEGVAAGNVTASGTGSASTASGTSDSRTGCGVILEVAVITMMVLSVGLVAAMTAN